MREFKDTEGKAWGIRVTAGTMVRVKGILGINLGELTSGDPPIIARFFTDAAFVAELVAAVLRPQLDAARITPEQFYERLDPEAAAEARDSLVEELRDFFQKFGPVAIAAAMGKMREAAAEEDQRLVAKVEAMTVDKMLGREEAATSGESVANSQQSPA